MAATSPDLAAKKTVAICFGHNLQVYRKRHPLRREATLTLANVDGFFHNRRPSSESLSDDLSYLALESIFAKTHKVWKGNWGRPLITLCTCRARLTQSCTASAPKIFCTYTCGVSKAGRHPKASFYPVYMYLYSRRSYHINGLVNSIVNVKTSSLFKYKVASLLQCLTIFLQGKKAIRRQAATLGARRSQDMRSRLEEMITGANKQDFHQRSSRKGRYLACELKVENNYTKSELPLRSFRSAPAIPGS